MSAMDVMVAGKPKVDRLDADVFRVRGDFVEFSKNVEGTHYFVAAYRKSEVVWFKKRE